MRRRFVFEVQIEYDSEDFEFDWSTNPETPRSAQEVENLLFAIQPEDAREALGSTGTLWDLLEVATYVRTEVEY